MICKRLCVSARENVYAYFINARARDNTNVWAHPRVSGENWVRSGMAATLLGSSPRERGKHFSTWGFTPQIGQILESLESCAYAEIYSLPVAYATDLRDQAQNTGRAPQSSKGASSK